MIPKVSDARSGRWTKRHRIHAIAAQAPICKTAATYSYSLLSQENSMRRPSEKRRQDEALTAACRMQSSASNGAPSRYISYTRYRAIKKSRDTEIVKLSCDSTAAEKADMASLAQEKKKKKKAGSKFGIGSTAIGAGV
ncbi:hypothetical protein J3F84DRAFT_67430 [Trichoderma pleuroticola]